MRCIEERKKWLDSHFFIKSETVLCQKNLKIERRKAFVGLSSIDDKVILPTIFDDITLLNSALVCVCIDKKIGFYDTLLGKWIVEPLCDSYSIHDFYGSIDIIQNGKHGLIDIEEHRLLISAYYDKVSINSKCRYIWVKKDGFYHYIKRSTGEKLIMSGAMEAYDSNMDENVMFIRKNGIVECVDEKGYLATNTFRRIMKRNHGRLKLFNSQEHSFVVIDIYGRILN